MGSKKGIDVRLLRGIGLFEGISSAGLNQVAGRCVISQRKKGERLFARGDEARHVYFVKSGKVSLNFRVSILLKNMDVTVDEVTEGGMIGWSALLRNRTSTLTASCVEDCELVQLDGKEMLSLCDKNPGVGYVLMRNLAKVIGARMDRMHILCENEIERNVPAIGGSGDHQRSAST